MGGHHTGEMSRAAGSGNDDLNILFFEFPDDTHGSLRGPVGGAYFDFIRYLNLIQEPDSFFHGGIIRIAAQDDSDLFFHFFTFPISVL
jgi:hypothetical protein